MNVLIWGTGHTAEELCQKGITAEIVGFIESKKKKECFRGLAVYGLNDKWPEYDYIIVASIYTDEIYEECQSMGIDNERMIYMRLAKRRFGQKDPNILYEILGEKNYTSYCIEYGLYNESFFEKDRIEYERQNNRENFKIDRNNVWPVMRDKYAYAGTVGNYFWQDLWAAKLIYKSGARKHFDIGSRMDGFIAHLLAMGVDVSMIDIRKFPQEVEGLHTIVDDATSLNQIPDDSIESMSALCSLEHFGLGRYGDPIDPEACFKAFENIQRKMKRGGQLYISLPAGKERVEFNAHRVFYPSTIKECFSNMQLVEFSCTAEGKMEYNVEIHKYDNDNHRGNYRYGLYHFIKQ